MRRWQFAAAMGAALVQPLAAFAQEAAPKVVGYLGAQSPEPLAERVRAFVQGLAETGQVEGRDVTIEYRWAQGNSDKLPALASELVRRQPAVIATAGSLAAARAAKAATTSIPIVFEIAAEPVEAGLVKSLTEPNGNLTGVVSLDGGIAALRELTPRAARIGVLINPAGNAAGGWSQAQAAARILGVRLQGLLATNEREFDAAFYTLLRVGAALWRSPPIRSSLRRASSSPRLRSGTSCRQCTSRAASPPPAGCSATLEILWNRIASPASMPAGFSRARSPQSCRSRQPPKANS